MKFKRVVAILMVLTFVIGIMPAASAAPKAKSIKLNKTTLELVGTSFTLKATISPSNASQKVTWSSSNKKVATVSSKGVVTPKGYGTTTITAKTADGRKTATCKVTVPRTKTYTKTHTVTSEWPYYAKDKISIIVDGVTGNIIDADVYQSKRDDGLVCLMQKDGCKIIYKCKDYVDVRTNWSISFGLWKFNYKVVDVTTTYRMYKNQKLVKLSYKTDW